jgi:hypothetical protein
MTFDDVNKTATIIAKGVLGSNNDYVATGLVIPENVVYNGEIYQVIKIDEYAFINTYSTGSLTIGNSVTSIGSYAFKNCNTLTGSLVIPGSVKTIDIGAFEGCSGFAGNLTIESGVEVIGDLAFHFNSGFTGILTIPNTVEAIGDNAFADCENISTIYLKDFDAPPA